MLEALLRDFFPEHRHAPVHEAKAVQTPVNDVRQPILDLAEAIGKLHRDVDLRKRLGNAARERIGTAFRNEDTVRNTIALYEELVPNPD